MTLINLTQRLNLLTLPLQGTQLIEASAGTGKTYTLAALYLRLLLGLGGNAAYLRPLCIDEILVVTFTEAATDELRGRIRENIHRLRLACVRGKSDDPLLASLLAQLPCQRQAALHLLAAERQIEEAAIFTIHGFCQRILNSSAVESGMLYQHSLLEDESFLCQQITADFWRRHCYPLPVEVARMVQQHWNGPESLLKELFPYLQGDPPIVRDPPNMGESILQRHARIISSLDDIKKQWQASAKTVQKIIKNRQLNHRIYNHKNLSSWLEKLTQWAKQPTEDYMIPKALERFRSSVLEAKTTSGEPPRHAFFSVVEAFYQQTLSLRELIFMMALTEIRQELKQEKRRRAEWGFDDLLNRLDRALERESGESLAATVRTRYPVAMIDEFQDTDPQQYRIFRHIYTGQANCALLLIGDPKQAIYAFRGADIFTYMRARAEVNAHYTLDTNWRSTPAMINAVNHLFQSQPAPFIFNDIPFSPIAASDHNAGLQLIVQRKRQPAMRIWLQPGTGIGVNEYQQFMANRCATTVRDWLSEEGESWFVIGESRHPLKASDITVLVRNRNEAALIRDALSALMIPSVYLSNHDSVFTTPEARELLWILQAIVTPEDDKTLRCALATSLIGLEACVIEYLNNNKFQWERQVEEFASYRKYWQTTSVLPMLRKLMEKYRIAENLLVSSDGERRLTDLLHLGELLQEASMQLKNKHTLLRWLAMQIASPNPKAVNQQLRLESDRPLVQIITVHKSKGLEFPVVFLPFAADFRPQKKPLFHDRQSYNALLDLNAAQDSLRLAEEERLAEDLRLLYVAVTRSIYHCSIGLAPLFRGSRKKDGVTDLHFSAFGYLIQQGQEGDAKLLRERLVALSALSGGDIELYEEALAPTTTSVGRGRNIALYKEAQVPQAPLNARYWQTPLRDPWQVTSYTKLQQNSNSAVMNAPLKLDIEGAWETKHKKTPELTPHTFPRGASSGTFLHNLLETLNFPRLLDVQWLNHKMSQQSINAAWLPIITRWMKQLIHTPLDGTGLSLFHLTAEKHYTELPFYFPIDVTVQAKDLDHLCKRYDPLSQRCPPLAFPQMRGMLKGFIDLVFRWQDRYYLLDYKANWLGEDNTAYNQQKMVKAIIAHRYELEYQLYTLALHRFLRYRLANYDYNRDFGGVFYLFLRGIDGQNPENGIYYCRPDVSFIISLDNFFAGVLPKASS